MRTLRGVASAMVAGAMIVAQSAAAFAQTPPAFGRTPSQADFDACNREAALSGGSALPGTTLPGTTQAPAGPGLGAPGGVGSRTSSAPANSATSAAGATGATGSLTGGSTLQGGTAGDPALRGLAQGQTDRAYQDTYRECMRRLGF